MWTSTFVYPSIKREPIVDKIFDREVPDPYRSLEDPESEITKQFVKDQNEITEPFLSICPHRSEIKDLLKKNQDYRKNGCMFKRGNKYYHFVHEKLMPQPILYQQDTIDSEPRVFFDPNELSEDGTVALTIASFTQDGEYFAYGLSYSGSDWIEIRIKNLATGETLPEKLTDLKFTSISWTHDNKGFFYSKYQRRGEFSKTEKNENHCLYYHFLNSPQSEDVLKVEFPEYPRALIGGETSHDGKHLHVFLHEGCKDQMWFYAEIGDQSSKDKLSLQPLYNKFEAEFDYISNNGDTVYFRTNLDAKNYKMVKLDLKNPSKENWVDVIPNHNEKVLLMAELYSIDRQDYIVVSYLKRVDYHLEILNMDGTLVKELANGDTISKYSGRRGDKEIFFYKTSFLSAGMIYHFDLTNLNSDARLLKENIVGNFNPNDYKIDKIVYQSKDGTEVPMFIVHRKDLTKDGQNPCILYGYGGFNARISSSFNVDRIAWLKNFKGIFAVANIRGGGELGQNWHDSGRLLSKQNSFDDFAAAAEYLINSKYTCRERIAIEGRSNGGLLVAAVSTQRPDLIGATICHVGVLDMIRYTSYTIGHAWTTDYGDPKEKRNFDNLIKYSPYHNVPSKVDHYPATLLLTADHDDRVVPAHSLKFIAELQHKLGKELPETPLLIRIETKAGHGAGRPLSKVIDEYTDVYSFLYNVLNLSDYYSQE